MLDFVAAPTVERAGFERGGPDLLSPRSPDSEPLPCVLTDSQMPVVVRRGSHVEDLDTRRGPEFAVDIVRQREREPRPERHVTEEREDLGRERDARDLDHSETVQHDQHDRDRDQRIAIGFEEVDHSVRGRSVAIDRLSPDTVVRRSLDRVRGRSTGVVSAHGPSTLRTESLVLRRRRRLSPSVPSVTVEIPARRASASSRFGIGEPPPPPVEGDSTGTA